MTEAPAPAQPAPIGADDVSRELSVVDPDAPDLRHIGVVGDNYTVLLDGAQTDGRYALIDMLVAPGGGPAPHRHDFEEMFHILDGEVTFTFRGETRVVTAGHTVNVPARAPHRFQNASGASARMLCMVTPPGLDEYFASWGEALPTRTALPELHDMDEIRRRIAASGDLAAHHRIEYVTH
jgi:quercetin dioxygenase-like cupin family protein